MQAQRYDATNFEDRLPNQPRQCTYLNRDIRDSTTASQKKISYVVTAGASRGSR